ncbi:hypothetical protein PIROE2DRAFT_58146 [Piromyces sp. E2]|nr:hypothetical protein PIROE2DRAFT_58146 [Piromyces sp. E2]|eukprot:OUM68391.1 hypothetical protein PIROE2DRAFT_58146 [Piromyces sp. E2]
MSNNNSDIIMNNDENELNSIVVNNNEEPHTENELNSIVVNNNNNEEPHTENEQNSSRSISEVSESNSNASDNENNTGKKPLSKWEELEQQLNMEIPSFASSPKLYGTTYKQSNVLFILQDITTSNILYTCGNNHFVDSIPNTNQIKKRKNEEEKEEKKEEKKEKEGNIEKMKNNITAKEEGLKRKNVQPKIPLTLIPIKGSNKYYCGFFFHNLYNTYFNKIPKQDLHIDLLKDIKFITEGLS